MTNFPTKMLMGFIIQLCNLMQLESRRKSCFLLFWEGFTLQIFTCKYDKKDCCSFADDLLTIFTFLPIRGNNNMEMMQKYKHCESEFPDVELLHLN